MTLEEPLTINERRKYLRKMQPIYRQASRKQPTALLTEMQIVTGLHRKSLIRLLRSDPPTPLPSGTRSVSAPMPSMTPPPNASNPSSQTLPKTSPATAIFTLPMTCCKA